MEKKFRIFCLLFLVKLLIFSTNHVSASQAYQYSYNKEWAEKLGADPNQAYNELFSKLDNLSHLSPREQLIIYYFTVEAASMLDMLPAAKKYASLGLALAEESDDQVFVIEFLLAHAQVAKAQGEYNNAGNYLYQAEKSNIGLENQRLKAQILDKKASLHNAMGRYPEAISAIQQALEIYKKFNDKDRLSLSYNLLSIIYYQLEEFEDAIKYIKESIQYDSNPEAYSLSIYHFNIGVYYWKLDDLVNAKENFQQAKALAKSISDTSTLISIDGFLAELLIEEEDFANAETLLLNGIDQLKDMQLLKVHFDYNRSLIDLYLKQNELEKAAPYLEVASEQSKKLDRNDVKLITLQAQQSYYEKTNQWQKASEIGKSIIDINSKVLKSNHDIELSKLKLNFDYTFNQEKLVSLEKENNLKDLMLEQENVKLVILMILAILAVICLAVISLALLMQKKAKNKFRSLSITDDLTGISNRRHLIRYLQETLKNQSDSNSKWAVILADLDYFKSINDNYGHAKGNEVLILFAEIAKKAFKSTDVVGRYGGEEWLFIIQEANEHSLKDSLQNFRSQYQLSGQELFDSEVTLSFSSGVILLENYSGSLDEILINCDKELYKAKHDGRNRDSIKFLSA